MFRNRDIVAIVFMVILSRMAWDDSSETLSAQANLAFYLSREGTTQVLSEMDLDGDGTSEALAIYTRQNSGFSLQILDLKRLHQSSRAAKQLAPFTPSVLFSSKQVENGDGVPVKMKMGHLVLDKGVSKKKKEAHPLAETAEVNDKNKHYFCGNDWHDAAQKCGTPCPGGHSGECPEGERCFADTPCNMLEYKESSKPETGSLLLTPGGGLPSLTTLWSNGVITFHSLVYQDENAEEQDTKKRSRRKKDKHPLELRLMWQVDVLPHGTSNYPDILWEESNILFLDSYSSQGTTSAQDGMIVISGSYFLNGAERTGTHSFVLALDASDGKTLWDNFINADFLFGSADMPLPLVRGVTSYARRRSRITSLKEDDNFGIDVMPDCTVTLKHQLRELMPFSYWSPEDATLVAAHLDWKRKKKENSHHHSKAKYVPGRSSLPKQHPTLHRKKKKWRKKKQDHPIYGRPNALAIQSKGGLQIRSLKNGHPLCHMSLLTDTVYSDLNNDGIMDQISVLLDTKRPDPSSEKWVMNLISKIMDDKQTQEQPKHRPSPNLCHAMVLSGVPANKELFSTSLCAGTNIEAGTSLDYVAPVVVESLSGRRNTRDFIVALNNGFISRLHGGSGRKLWQTQGHQRYHNFPTWELGSSENTLLTRLPTSNVPPPIQPVLLAGENSLAVLSVKNGAVLAIAEFPQTSIVRPMLAEVSGDGTMDVIVVSKDGIWCFQIIVNAGSRVVFRIMVGLLLMGLMLALLANRVGQHGGKDKRSTDM